MGKFVEIQETSDEVRANESAILRHKPIQKKKRSPSPALKKKKRLEADETEALEAATVTGDDEEEPEDPALAIKEAVVALVNVILKDILHPAAASYLDSLRLQFTKSGIKFVFWEKRTPAQQSAKSNGGRTTITQLYPPRTFTYLYNNTENTLVMPQDARILVDKSVSLAQKGTFWTVDKESKSLRSTLERA